MKESLPVKVKCRLNTGNQRDSSPKNTNSNMFNNQTRTQKIKGEYTGIQNSINKIKVKMISNSELKYIYTEANKGTK